MDDIDMMPAAAASSASAAAAATAAAASSSSTGGALPVSSRYTYIVTAQSPTIITHACVCKFTSPTETNLIVARSTRLEIYRCVEEGLESLFECALYGRIAAMVTYKAKADATERLFITTERHKFFVLKWDADARELKTEAQGDSKLKIGRLSEQAPLAMIDPTSSWFGLHQYDGLFQMLAVDPTSGQLDKTLYDCKFDQLQVIQLTFLHKVAKPTLLVLSVETTAGQDRRVLRSYTYEAKEKELRPAPHAINCDNCPVGAAHIIPTVFGGAILIAEETVSYFPANGRNPLIIQVPDGPWHVTAWAAIEPRRFLLGDLAGGLHVLLLEDGPDASPAASSSSSVTLGANLQLRIEYLGKTSIAHKLQYIDNGYVLVGSLYGDSQLIQLSTEPIVDEEDEADAEMKTDDMDTSESTASSAKKPKRPTFLRVVNTFPNIGSIVDMAMLDLDRSGQCQAVTCSGAYQDSSLRIIRNGIGLTEEASIDLEGIQGVWGVRASTQDEYHKYLVQTYASQTRMLALEQEEDSEELALAECEIAGFDAEARTVHAGNMGGALLLQVTAQSCRLVDANTLQLVDEWRANAAITVATSNATQLLVAAGKLITLLKLEGNKFRVDQQVALDEEVSCMDITPPVGASSASYAALCMWRDNTVRVYSLAPTLIEVGRERLGDMMARSVLFTQFDGAAGMSDADASTATTFLLCGLGDGNLVSFEFQSKTAALTARKTLTLGTSGLELSTFRSRGELHVFVSCDRPTVVSHAHGKLRYSNVNLRDLTHCTPFHAPVFRDCLALVSGTQLMIGHIDEIEKLHIKKIDTHGHARRLAHQASTHTLAVAVIEENLDETSLTGETCRLKLYDDQSFAQIADLVLEKDEQAQCIISAKVNVATVAGAAAAASSIEVGGNIDYFIVGTAYIDEKETEPSAGRILVLQADVNDRDRASLRIVASATIKGSASSLDTIQGRIIAGVNAQVVVYRCLASFDSPPGEFSLEKECSYVGNVFILRLRVSHDQHYVMVQDLFKSVSVLVFNAPSNTNTVQTATTACSLEEVARHYDSLWLTASESFSAADDVLLTADHHLNLVTLRRNLDPSVSAEERQRLEVAGQWHSGEFINCIVRGSLVMNMPNDTADTTAASAASSAHAAEGSADDRVIPTHVLGSTSGALLVAAPLSPAAYKFFARLEEALETTVRGVGGLSHREWRQFQEEKRCEESKAFVDGDLIQLFLELTPKQQAQVVAKIDPNLSVQLCVKRVEDISRIH